MADPYVSAKAALRDNVKTLMTVFAGVAGVLVAGSPFTGFGALPWGWRFGLAACSLLAAVLLVAHGMRRLLAILRPDLVYPNVLRSDFKLDTVADPAERAELEALKAEFERVKPTLLPMEYATTYEAYHGVVKSLGRDAEQSQSAVDMALWTAHAARLEELSHWAALTRLHQRVRRGLREVFVIGLAALLAVGLFSWAANPPRPQSEPTNIIVAGPPPAPPVAAASAPTFGPVLFETGVSTLSTQSVRQVAAVREHLKAHPGTGVLLHGHTDTEGSDARNVVLARQRVDAVAALLRAPGGVASSRVFVSAPGPADAPVLTGPKVPLADNRAVRFDVIDLPSR